MPADGVAQFAGNAAQIGLLVVVLVAASALAFDARREMAVFLRTRVRGVASVILPAYLVTTGAAAAGLALGTLAAWYETAVLLGELPAGAVLLGLGCGVIFLAFAVAVVALMAALVRGVAAAAGCALALLLGLAVVGGLTGTAWLPVTLATATEALVRGEPAAGLLPALLLTAALTVFALIAAVRLASRREI
ncbi:ABC transporter [Nonomuraea soli]|uniref:ABC-2 type transport system permease protein n=1 Tax=Nonomuraea soli TaxID=1032476 RepID=A0A7W0HNQ9_9ACTN|nr:ABC transporter [Nonomuraea soli]MBA2890002.1 ABC-2 type transport system permease protein [Nonomuraea soli]